MSVSDIKVKDGSSFTSIYPTTLAHGGTSKNLSSAPSLLVNLASTTAADVFQSAPRPGVYGILPVSKGGTGKSSLPYVNVLGKYFSSGYSSLYSSTVSFDGGMLDNSAVVLIRWCLKGSEDITIWRAYSADTLNSSTNAFRYNSYMKEALWYTSNGTTRIKTFNLSINDSNILIDYCYEGTLQDTSLTYVSTPTVSVGAIVAVKTYLS